MDERLKIQLNAENSNKLNQIYQFVNENSFLLDNKVSSRNGLANQLFGDYLSLLGGKWESNPNLFYSDFKKKILNHNHDHSLDELVKLEHHNRDLMNMILYLTMDTNRSMMRGDMKSYEKLQSMFRNGTTENNMYGVLANLVYQDNQVFFKKLHRQGENLI